MTGVGMPCRHRISRSVEHASPDDDGGIALPLPLLSFA